MITEGTARTSRQLLREDAGIDSSSAATLRVKRGNCTAQSCSRLAARSDVRIPFGRIVAFSALAFSLFSGASLANTEIVKGIVIKVRDGDTVQLLTYAGRRIEVRLNAIDAPEKASESMPGQPHAERARAHLSQLAAKRRATLSQTTMDRYGRHVGLLSVESAQGRVDAGLWQIQSGMAWVHTRYLGELPVKLRQSYLDAEGQARSERRGLWRDRKSIPPWEWRQRHRQSSPKIWEGTFVALARDGRANPIRDQKMGLCSDSPS